MEDISDKSQRPLCPYCDDDSGECDHVILDYDASFGEFLSGYLARDNQEMESFKGELLKLMNQGIEPKIDDDFLTDIWESAYDSVKEEPHEIDLGYGSYLGYLEQNEYSYDAISFRYPGLEEEDDEIPGQSSAYIIFYSEVPEKTIHKLNSDIISELRGV